MTNISVPGYLTDIHICRQFCACSHAKGEKKPNKILQTIDHRQNVSNYASFPLLIQPQLPIALDKEN